MEHESALITKLHAKLSLFRRDRDDALRHKELAVERARIVRKDRESAAAEVRAMQSKLVEMRDETKRKLGEISVVEREVEGLRMEYKFQHSELTSKREKLSRLDAKRSADLASRNASATSSLSSLRKRREKSSSLNAPGEWSLEEKKRRIESVLSEDAGAEEWMASLPEWIGRRVECVLEEADDVGRECILLRRKIAGYQNVLGVVDGVGMGEVNVGEEQ